MRVSSDSSGREGTAVRVNTVPCWYETTGSFFCTVSGTTTRPEASVRLLPCSGITVEYCTL